MCIVSIFSNETGDFLLTHNRDESRLRPFSEQIQTAEYHHKNWTGPLDLVSGGTWIYYSDEYACCILNGAYDKHSHRPPYRLSRGLLILELLNYSSIDQFIDRVNLKKIEPFTMIMLKLRTVEKKILVWDGTERFVEDLSDEKLIVRSSSPLYSPDEKSAHFKAFNELESVDSEGVFELHERIKLLPGQIHQIVQTTSITQIEHCNQHTKLKFCPIH
ncbi:MAG: NRDE family protein [Weeksellaceae bacterium]|jgi:hypothetical protein|nr:NRDE family protein [Weeksellaceae bacterium]